MTDLEDKPLIDRWLQVCEQINKAKNKQNHENLPQEKDVRLLAVSKTKSAQMVATLFQAGQVDFGENYLQEAIDKMSQVNKLLTISSQDKTNNPQAQHIIWHYIGHIQRNKTRDIAANFDWVHTIERDIIAKRLNEQRPDTLPKLNVLIQVNIDNEESKSGCKPDDVNALIDSITGYERLCLRGLMIIPSKLGSGVNSSAFARTKALFDDMAAKHKELDYWDTLSMGMSADLQEAIEYGSTMVRVGSAIFGERV